MRLFAFACFGLALTVSCASQKKLLRANPAKYTLQQKALIKEGSAQRAMKLMVITNSFDSILLRQKSAPIDIQNEKELNTYFASRLETTMTSAMGVGIAAPQVGILKQMICVQRFDKEGFPNEIFINPVITKYSEEKQDCREGCLSIPGRSDTTQIRALTIALEYQTLEGENMHETVTGFTAVIFQHEIDHLNGILYIDHLKEEMKGK
ncbi:MAG: peptide deformylase [Bacteroidia bacterium]